MKKILIIAFTDLQNDPRVYRQIRYLKHNYHVSTVGLEPAQIEGVSFHQIISQTRFPLTRLRRALEYKVGRFEKLYWSLYPFDPLIETLSKERFDLIIANDIDTLPFALKIANGAKVLLDLHEYAPRQFEDRFIWRFIFRAFNHYLCKTYMKECDQVTTVSSGLADEYYREYGIRPALITNACEYVPLEPQPVDKDRIRIITHGVANPNRRLELMIKVMDYVDSRFHLDMMLLPTYPRYYKRLQAMAAKRGNVTVIPPVDLAQIVPTAHGYDLSFLVFKPSTINFKYGLFNKFFESIQARLAIISGPSPTPHVELINRYGCGLVVDSYNIRDIAGALNRLNLETIEEYKQKSHCAAKELNAEENRRLLEELVSRLISRPGITNEARSVPPLTTGDTNAEEIKVKPSSGKLLSFLHRALLHVWPYKKLIILLGLDSYRYKKYYKTLDIRDFDKITYAEVDGYQREGEFERVVWLVDNLAGLVPTPGKILDIGCGTGRYLNRMATVWPGTHLEGLDISSEIVENFTRKQVPGIPVHIIDIETDETFHIDNAGSFDLVCMIGIIQIISLRKIDLVLNKVHSLCKNGGYLYIQFNIETEQKKSSVGYKRYSIEDLEALLVGHGFEIVQSAPLGVLKDYAYTLSKKK
jgi:SAM-dependent methyltransferase/glycosyltransferase involved in cell wall biosynthesis